MKSLGFILSFLFCLHVHSIDFKSHAIDLGSLLVNSPQQVLIDGELVQLQVSFFVTSVQKEKSQHAGRISFGVDYQVYSDVQVWQTGESEKPIYLTYTDNDGVLNKLPLSQAPQLLQNKTIFRNMKKVYFNPGLLTVNPNDTSEELLHITNSQGKTTPVTLWTFLGSMVPTDMQYRRQIKSSIANHAFAKTVIHKLINYINYENEFESKFIYQEVFNHLQSLPDYKNAGVYFYEAVVREAENPHSKVVQLLQDSNYFKLFDESLREQLSAADYEKVTQHSGGAEKTQYWRQLSGFFTSQLSCKGLFQGKKQN